jgi:hypothetical protein
MAIQIRKTTERIFIVYICGCGFEPLDVHLLKFFSDERGPLADRHALVIADNSK